VLAEVDAAALLAGEAAGCDLADERVRRVEQVPETLGAAYQPCVVPERGAGIRWGRDRRGVGVEARALERGEPRAAAEDEALEQRVRGEPVRPVHSGACALAGGVQPGNGGASVQ